MSDESGFFGTQHQKTVIDPNDPRRSWARRKLHELDASERLEAARVLAFLVADLGHTLHEFGLDERFFSAMKLVSSEVATAIRAGGSVPQVQQALPPPTAAPEPPEVPTPPPDEPARPVQGVVLTESAEEMFQEALRIERRNARQSSLNVPSYSRIPPSWRRRELPRNVP